MNGDQIQFHQAQNGWLAIYRSETRIATTDAECDALLHLWRSGEWDREIEQARSRQHQAMMNNGARNAINNPYPMQAGTAWTA